jgi:hypothetical protein
MPSSKFEDRPIIQKGFDKKKTVLRETLIQNHLKKHKPHATRGSQASQCSEFSQKHQWKGNGAMDGHPFKSADPRRVGGGVKFVVFCIFVFSFSTSPFSSEIRSREGVRGRVGGGGGGVRRMDGGSVETP